MTLFRRRCCPHWSSGARDRFSSHPRVSNRSANPRARRLSMRISRKALERTGDATDTRGPRSYECESDPVPARTTSPHPSDTSDASRKAPTRTDERFTRPAAEPRRPAKPMRRGEAHQYDDAPTPETKARAALVPSRHEVQTHCGGPRTRGHTNGSADTRSDPNQPSQGASAITTRPADAVFSTSRDRPRGVRGTYAAGVPGERLRRVR